jgi:hypothetical protein
LFVDVFASYFSGWAKREREGERLLVITVCPVNHKGHIRANQRKMVTAIPARD